MMANYYKFPMGLSLWDMSLYLLTRGLLPALLIIFFVMMVPIFVIAFFGVVTGSVAEAFCMSGLFFFILMIAVSITIIMFVPLIMARYAIFRRSTDNFTVVKMTEVVAYRQGSYLYPVIMNRIPRDLIDKIEPADEDYFRQRWMNTPWYIKIGFLHKYPHGGLYYPMTDKRNLLILYLKEPIMFTNEEWDLFRSLRRGPGFLKTLPVSEVVLDVKRSDHDGFVNCVMGKW